MTVVALEWKRCGGSLPAPGGGSPFVTCPYCGMGHEVSAPAIALAPEVQGPSDYELRHAAAKTAWDAARASSTDPVVALRAVVGGAGVTRADPFRSAKGEERSTAKHTWIE